MNQYTTQKEVRMAFWENIEGLNRKNELDYKKEHGFFRVDTRCAFCDYVDVLQRNGQISENLAFNVTLA